MKNAAAAPEIDSPPLPAPLWKRRWFKNAAMSLLAAAGVYALIYRDVVARARESYQRAETYMAWHLDPASKKNHFERKFAADRDALERQLADKEISRKEFLRRVDTLEFDRDFALGESSLKYAYHWYKDTYELFSPPESRWVREARKKAPEVLELWKQELRSQKIPFEDTMFE